MTRYKVKTNSIAGNSWVFILNERTLKTIQYYSKVLFSFFVVVEIFLKFSLILKAIIMTSFTYNEISLLPSKEII